MCIGVFSDVHKVELNFLYVVGGSKEQKVAGVKPFRALLFTI